MLDSVASLSGSLGAPVPSRNPEQIKSAAQQFEALMIGELLKSARADGDSASFLGAGDDDQTGQTAVDYAEQQMASMISKSGGLGLSRFIEHALTPRTETTGTQTPQKL